jgi:hypothetical protein
MRASATKTCFIRGGKYPNVSATTTLSSSDNGTTWSYHAPDGVGTAVFTGNDTFGGPFFTIGGVDITIDGLDLGHVGGAGTPMFIHVVGGASNTTIRNNTLHHSTQYSVVIDGPSSDTSVINNRVENIGYQGISAFAQQGPVTGSVIANNYLGDICTATPDCGGIYSYGSASSTGAKWRYNYIRNVGAGGGGAGLYADDLTSDLSIIGNVISGTKFACFHHHSGINVLATGNICDLGDAVWEGNRPQDIVFYQYIDGPMTGNTWTNNLTVGNAAGTGNGYAGSDGPPVPLQSRNNSYWNNGTGGNLNHTGFGGAGDDTNPTHQNPKLNCDYQLASDSPVFGAPTSFPPQPAGWGTPGFWGPPGFVVPTAGTPPSAPCSDPIPPATATMSCSFTAAPVTVVQGAPAIPMGPLSVTCK